MKEGLSLPKRFWSTPSEYLAAKVKPAAGGRLTFEDRELLLSTLFDDITPELADVACWVLRRNMEEATEYLARAAKRKELHGGKADASIWKVVVSWMQKNPDRHTTTHWELYQHGKEIGVDIGDDAQAQDRVNTVLSRMRKGQGDVEECILGQMERSFRKDLDLVKRVKELLESLRETPGWNKENLDIDGKLEFVTETDREFDRTLKKFLTDRKREI